MPTAELKPPVRLALIALLLSPEKEVTDPVLYERFRVKVAKAGRDTLEPAGFITFDVRKNTNFHRLTAKGREHARALLTGPAPEKAGGSMADVRLLYAIGKLLDRVIRDYGLDDEKVFHPDSEGQRPLPKPRPEPAVDVEDKVLAAYHSLAKRHGGLVSLVRLRDQLPGIDRETLDKTLKAMDRSRVIQLEPEPNQKALPPEARDAAIRIGGEDKHLITIGHR
jgi:hypothetical protein